MIQYSLIVNILAALVFIVSLFMLVPAGIALYNGNATALGGFLYTIIPALIVCVLLYLSTRRYRRRYLRPHEGFLLVTLSWIAASAIGALPFVLSGEIPSYTDAFFETISGFTTTGASILTDIEGMAPSYLFWRSLTHWLGGMGIVVLTVAILPILGIGGMQLMRAESPGPTLEKISPKVAETAKILWMIYLGLTVLETALLMFGGMSLFDALTHTFGTLATGGFSPKAASVGHYNSAYIDIVITVFMVAAGLNFGLYYRALQGKFRDLVKNSEFIAYLAIFAISSVAIAVSLNRSVYESFGTSLRYAGFQAATIITTTGYATADFDLWPAFSKFVLFFLMFIGGCSGSTGGGIKVIRIVTLFKQAVNEMKYLFRQRGVHLIRINGETVRKDFIYTVVGFVFLYFLCLMITTAVVASGGYDLVTSFSSALVTVGNIGPGFALVGPTMNYSFYEPYIKWVLSAAMLIGRLEVYTVLVLFVPAFWRR